ncbi:MAG: hypothetical protein WKF95_16030 [Rubrobacter sp.]
MDSRKSAKDRWEEAYSKTPERDAEFSTMSEVQIKPLYTPEDVEGEAIELHLEVLQEEGHPVPEPGTSSAYVEIPA